MATLRNQSPSRLPIFAPISGGTAAEVQLLSDRDTLREITAGLDRLEALIDNTTVLAAAAQRGYFTPDEDDRVRRALLASRNYRLAAYEIIFRYRDFARITDRRLRLRSFLIGFAAALSLYAKSLKIIQVAEHQPLLRAKLNEPDGKFELAGGFFDEVIVGYSSLLNYRMLARADRLWRGQRRSQLFRDLDGDNDWHWVGDLIRRKRMVVRKRLCDVLKRRLRYDWRAFWRTALRPARQTRYGLQSLLGGRFAGVHVVPNPVHVLTPAVLGALWPQLQPGDVLLCRAEGKLTAALLPGFWSRSMFICIRTLSNIGTKSLRTPARSAASSRGSPRVFASVRSPPASTPITSRCCAPTCRVRRLPRRSAKPWGISASPTISNSIST